MPSLYAPGQHDMAGYCVGIVEHSRILPRFDLYQPGDLLIGLPSSGLHCAGFNEILTQLAASKVNLRERSPVDGGDDGLTLAHVLATPTQLYVGSTRSAGSCRNLRRWPKYTHCRVAMAFSWWRSAGIWMPRPWILRISR